MSNNTMTNNTKWAKKWNPSASYRSFYHSKPPRWTETLDQIALWLFNAVNTDSDVVAFVETCCPHQGVRQGRATLRWAQISLITKGVATYEKKTVRFYNT